MGPDVLRLKHLTDEMDAVNNRLETHFPDMREDAIVQMGIRINAGFTVIGPHYLTHEDAIKLARWLLEKLAPVERRLVDRVYDKEAINYAFAAAYNTDQGRGHKLDFRTGITLFWEELEKGES